MHIEVRVAGHGDIAAIARLRARWTEVDSDAAFEQRLSGWLAGEGERRTVWLGFVGSQTVGMASVLEYRRMPRPGRPDSRWGYLSNMFVCEEFRNRGVGSALLATIIAAAEARLRAAGPLAERAGSSVLRAGGIHRPGRFGGRRPPARARRSQAGLIE